MVLNTRALLSFLSLSLLSSLSFFPTSSSAAAAYNRTMAYDLSLLSMEVYVGLVFGRGYKLREKFTFDIDFGYLAAQGDVCALVFRGSDNPGDWEGVTGNKNRTLTSFTAADGSVMAFTHSGFTGAYNVFRSQPSFLTEVRKCLQEGQDKKLFIAGHSRGAALASLAAIHFAKDASLDFEGGEKKYDLSRLRQAKSPFLQLYTYGEPQSLFVKDPSPSSSVSGIMEDIVKFRFVNRNDDVPIPKPQTTPEPFTHWGSAYHLTGFRVVEVDLNFPAPKDPESGNKIDHMVNFYVVPYY